MKVIVSVLGATVMAFAVAYIMSENGITINATALAMFVTGMIWLIIALMAKDS